MNCNIKCIKDNEEGERYWCLAHRAPSINGKECTSEVKEFYDNIADFTKKQFESIKIVYSDITKKLIPEVYINGKKIDGIIKINNSLIEPKDFGGLMLSKLNKIKLEDSICPYCSHSHSDDGKFAYMPHARHLCQYCGKMFKVDFANIGNEMALYLDIPELNLDNNIIKISDSVCVTYDILSGILLINGINVNRVIVNSETISLAGYLNNILKDKF